MCNDNICSLANSFIDAGFTPLIDWIVPDADQLDAYRTKLGIRLRRVVLDPGAQTCIARNQQRPLNEQFAFEGHAQLRTTMWDGFGSLGWWLDSSNLDAECTTRQIVQEAYERAAC